MQGQTGVQMIQFLLLGVVLLLLVAVFWLFGRLALKAGSNVPYPADWTDTGTQEEGLSALTQLQRSLRALLELRDLCLSLASHFSGFAKAELECVEPDISTSAPQPVAPGSGVTPPGADGRNDRSEFHFVLSFPLGAMNGFASHAGGRSPGVRLPRRVGRERVR